MIAQSQVDRWLPEHKAGLQVLRDRFGIPLPVKKVESKQESLPLMVLPDIQALKVEKGATKFNEKHGKTSTRFDRKKYMREYMAKRRTKKDKV